jgi:phosphopantothenoylcysteine decarboxylase/phosphopantothenate--cysteine ligase
MGRHSSLDITGSLGSDLAGKRIVLAVTGSVAAMRSPELARLLMRHGAEVVPVMSAAACRLIGPDLMHWACGHEAITDLSGAVEHVALAGAAPDKPTWWSWPPPRRTR